MIRRLERWFATAAVTAVLLVASACAADEGPEAGGDSAVETEAAAAGSEGSTPSDGTSAASYDPTAVRKRVLDLYVTRQEYIEMYWGPGGRLAAGESLGAAVEASEARFHDLMIMLGETPPPPASRVSEAGSAVVAAHELVLEEARSAGISLDPTTADSLIEGTPSGGLEDWIAEVRAGLENLPLEAVGTESGS